MKIDEKQLKQIQLDILKKVDTFCRENNIKYYLGYGTLLGAVRHGGYIPWDDDIDIVMPRPDYEKLKKLFYKSDSEYEIRDYEIDKSFLYSLGKVEYKKSVVKENVNYKSEIGVNIDIFVLDGIKDSNKKNINKVYWLNNLYNLKQIVPKKGRKLYKNILLIVGQLLARVIPIELIIKKMIDLSKNTGEYDKAEYVCAVLGAEKNNPIFLKEWFDTIELEFEGCSFFAPRHYDEILRGWYGEYMELPPPDQRVTHHDASAYLIE